MGCSASVAPDLSNEVATKAFLDTEEDFVLQTSPEAPLGIKFSIMSGRLLVRLVEGGAIALWNAEHPARQVVVGNEILRVNGESEDLAKMLTQLHTVGQLEIRFRRTAPPSSWSGTEKRQRPENPAVGGSQPQKPAKATQLVELPFVSAAHLEDPTCCICLENMEQDVRVLKLPCQHHFHLDCGAQWLRQKGTCPLCVRPLIQPDGQPVCCAARAAEADAAPRSWETRSASL